jgi:CTP synthase
MMDDETRRKIAQYTNVAPEAVITSRNAETTIYEIPLMFYRQKLDQIILKKMGVEYRHADITPWTSVMDRVAARSGKVRIGIIGKYMDLHDSYKSVYESLFHAGLECAVEVELIKIDSSGIEETEASAVLDSAVDAVLVPGGFGQHGINGMLKAVSWARENKIPFFGICLGMQLMAIEWARNVLGWADADSREFNHGTKHPVVSLLEEQSGAAKSGRTMRLGKGESVAEDGTRILAAYGEKHIWERHRHSYELSDKYRAEMEASGLRLAALTPDRVLVDCIEWPDHPWGVGVQFHPEYKSRPTRAAPLFRDFVAAAKQRAGSKAQ